MTCDEASTLIALYNVLRFAEAENRARALLGQYLDFGFGWKLLGGVLQLPRLSDIHFAVAPLLLAADHTKAY